METPVLFLDFSDSTSNLKRLHSWYFLISSFVQLEFKSTSREFDVCCILGGDFPYFAIITPG